MINWKVVVGSGATAAVLSLLTGIISGVSFDTLLLRALIWSVVFCGVGAAISFLISRYLPELTNLSSNEGQAEARPNIDIVLPDENPHIDRENDDRPTADDTVFETFDSVGKDEAANAGRELPPAAGDNLVEEVEELGSTVGGPRGRNAGPSLDDVEEAEELPDFDGDTDDFAASGDMGGSRSDDISDITGMSSRSGTVDILGLQADSEDIAQAIRTALKKDQKG